MFVSDDTREIRDPAVLHAFYLLSDCSHNCYETDHTALDEARALSREQIRDLRPTPSFDLKHWLHVYAVLNHETKGNC